jgi:hypothetical protein
MRTFSPCLAKGIMLLELIKKEMADCGPYFPNASVLNFEFSLTATIIG